MNIDLLPFSAFALESSGAAARAVSEVHTLTLRLELAAPPADGAMSGTLSLEACADAALQVSRAAVVPVPGAPITLTFEP